MSEDSYDVAFLGLGVMGGAMAANLGRADLSITAWNRTAGKPGVQVAEAAGATVTDSIAEAVAHADIVMVCVSDVPDVHEVVLDPEGGVVAHARPGTLIVDFSTIGPAAARELHSELAAADLRYLEAPVTGGDVGAREATLTIMAGGDEEDFEQARPYLTHLGSRIHLCGGSGQGQATKLANQVLCAINTVAVSEALALADALGADRRGVVEICSTGAGGSWALSNLGPKMLDGDLDPGFMIQHMLKDLRLVSEHCRDADLRLPAVEIATARYGEADPGAGTQAVFSTYAVPSPE